MLFTLIIIIVIFLICTFSHTFVFVSAVYFTLFALHATYICFIVRLLHVPVPCWTASVIVLFLYVMWMLFYNTVQSNKKNVRLLLNVVIIKMHHMHICDHCIYLSYSVGMAFLILHFRASHSSFCSECRTSPSQQSIKNNFIRHYIIMSLMPLGLFYCTPLCSLVSLTVNVGNCARTQQDS